MNISWSHCVLRVRDIDAMVSFYCDLFDFKIADEGPLGPDGPKIVFLSGSSSDHHQIAFVASRGPEDATSLDHNAFRVESVAGVQEMAGRLTADDRVAHHAPVTHGNAISVYFADPEGNGIEVFCDSPWHVAQPQLKGWNPAGTPEEVLASVEEAFRDEPDFGPIEDYRAAKAKEFGEA
ncbi:MAG: catechol 2,3-dioxygenase [Myxococcota bacterium]|jgi:catechol 2,3-dioxygenase